MSGILALTGATGKKSGGVLAEYLADNLKEVEKAFPGGIRALVRKTSDTTHLKKLIPSLQLCTGSLDDPEFLKQSFEGVDTVIHIAGIHYSSKITDAAVACNVRRLIFVHTTGIYSKFKAAGEEYRRIDSYVSEVCLQNNIKLTICRPTMIYGNEYDNNVTSFIKMVDRFPLMPVVNGARYELQPVHYKDLGKAYYDILMNEETTANKNFNLSGKNPIMLRDMLSIIGKNLGKKTRFISCPFAIAYAGACLSYRLPFIKRDYREKVQRLCEPRVYSHEEATSAFGYDPVSFEEGVVEEVKEYLKRKQSAGS